MLFRKPCLRAPVAIAASPGRRRWVVRNCSHLVKNRSVQLILCIASLALTACAPPASNDVPPILLFNGTGTSPNDVEAVEAVLKDSHFKYSYGTPAIVEGSSGKGWVILCGVHPEAPESWRRGMTFATPASIDNAYAGRLIDAALHGTCLPHY